jgi:hypothetical protein
MVRSSADKTHARFKIPGGLQNTRNINQHLLSSNRLQKVPHARKRCRPVTLQMGSGGLKALAVVAV